MLNSGQKRIWPLLIIIAALIVVILGGYWWWLNWSRQSRPDEELPRMAGLPPKEEVKIPPAPEYPPDAPVLEQVRRALREGISPTEAVQMAESLPDRPETADAAFLLLEYAAEKGNPEAALAVGRYYDPSYSGASGTIQKNPVTAYEWYREALAGGQDKAEVYLASLRQWVEERAVEGSYKAQELLNNWQ